MTRRERRICAFLILALFMALAANIWARSKADEFYYSEGNENRKRAKDYVNSLHGRGYLYKNTAVDPW